MTEALRQRGTSPFAAAVAAQLGALAWKTAFDQRHEPDNTETLQKPGRADSRRVLERPAEETL